MTLSLTQSSSPRNLRLLHRSFPFSPSTHIIMRASLFYKSLVLGSGAFLLARGLGTSASSSIAKRATFGAGCYWGTEKFFKDDFGVKAFQGSGKVLDGKVGFMGPPTAKLNPTYREVCTGNTQHVEVYDLTFEGDEKTYEDLVKHFYSFHDPTTLNQQGNDRGTQYASAIFCHDDAQMAIARRVTAELQEKVKAGKVPRYRTNTITTAITRATTFYPAHEDHQQYLDKNPGGYCNHGYRFTQWPQ